MARVIILSGAGISAESGINTFRESGGLWDQYDVSVVCNYDSLEKNEALTVAFYDKRRLDIESKEPNHAHKMIAKLKKQYPSQIAVLTQNVDDLFEKAGLEGDEVVHLHGFLTELRCRNLECEKIYEIGYTKQQNFNHGLCPQCNEKLRPNIVFFGEPAPMYERFNKEIIDCEMFVVIGTSGNVIGVNTLAAFVEHSILNNLEPSDAIDDQLFSTVIYDKASIAIDTIAVEIERFLN